MADGVDIIRAPALDGIAHGFLGRRGGVSTGKYASLNVGLGSDDDPMMVEKNRVIAANSVLPGATLVTLRQVHSADVIDITGPIALADRPEADAMVTATPGILLGILTADCVPVLFCDAKARVVGAAHAGWKGLFGGILENTIAAMTALGAEAQAIATAIGPCIRQPSYEVDDAFRERFTDHDAASAAFFVNGRAGHWQCDLAGYAALRLTRAGIGRIDDIGGDTFAEPERFFSYRYGQAQGYGDYGRQISVIGLQT